MTDAAPPEKCIPVMFNDKAYVEVCNNTPAGINLINLYREHAQSVVQIVNTRESGPSKSSGFFVTADGEIATDFHSVKNANKLSVITADHQVLDATVIAVDEANDVALIKPTASALLGQFLPVTLTDDAKVGSDAFGMGHPYGVDDTITAIGEVSKHTHLNEVHVEESLPPEEDKNRDLILLNMYTAKGFSGGPLFNSEGLVPGIIAFGGGVPNTGVTPAYHIRDLMRQVKSTDNHG